MLAVYHQNGLMNDTVNYVITALIKNRVVFSRNTLRRPFFQREPLQSHPHNAIKCHSTATLRILKILHILFFSTECIMNQCHWNIVADLRILITYKVPFKQPSQMQDWHAIIPNKCVGYFHPLGAHLNIRQCSISRSI